MNNNLVNEITARQLRNDVPDFRSGDDACGDGNGLEHGENQGEWGEGKLFYPLA